MAQVPSFLQNRGGGESGGCHTGPHTSHSLATSVKPLTICPKLASWREGVAVGAATAGASAAAAAAATAAGSSPRAAAAAAAPAFHPEPSSTAPSRPGAEPWATAAAAAAATEPEAGGGARCADAPEAAEETPLISSWACWAASRECRPDSTVCSCWRVKRGRDAWAAQMKASIHSWVGATGAVCREGQDV